MKNKKKIIFYSVLIFFTLLLVWNVKGSLLLYKLRNPQGKKAVCGLNELTTKNYLNLIPLHTVKTPPAAHDWLAHHPEPGETFEEYARAKITRPTEKRDKIYFAFLGEFNEAEKNLIKKAAEFTEGYYQMPVKFTESIPLDIIPAKARRKNSFTLQEQILSTYIMEEVLIPRIPDDAMCLMAFTSADLWPGAGWNFVFGQASIEDRVAVMSLYRKVDSKKMKDHYILYLKRVIQTAIHEIGHMFSLKHCIFYECMMNGSNHLKESDTRPLWLCPVDLRKLMFNIEGDPIKRFKELERLLRDWGLEEDAKFYNDSIDAFLDNK